MVPACPLWVLLSLLVMAPTCPLWVQYLILWHRLVLSQYLTYWWCLGCSSTRAHLLLLLSSSSFLSKEPSLNDNWSMTELFLLLSSSSFLSKEPSLYDNWSMTELFLNPCSPVPAAELLILPWPGTLFVWQLASDQCLSCSSTLAHLFLLLSSSSFLGQEPSLFQNWPMSELFLNPCSPVPSAELLILPWPGTLFVWQLANEWAVPQPLLTCSFCWAPHPFLARNPLCMTTGQWVSCSTTLAHLFLLLSSSSFLGQEPSLFTNPLTARLSGLLRTNLTDRNKTGVFFPRTNTMSGNIIEHGRYRVQSHTYM